MFIGLVHFFYMEPGNFTFFSGGGKKIHVNQFSFAKKNGTGRVKLWSDESVEEIRKGVEPMTFPQRE